MASGQMDPPRNSAENKPAAAITPDLLLLLHHSATMHGGKLLKDTGAMMPATVPVSVFYVRQIWRITYYR